VAVEDGRPFCPQCRAPQIHVLVALPDSETADQSVGGQAPAWAHEIPQGIPRFDHPRLLQHGLFDRGAATRAALKAGVLGAFVGMLIPVAGIVLTGWMAFYFYRRELGLSPGARIGSRLGGAAGVVCFAINAIFIVIELFLLHRQQQFIESMMKVAQAIGYSPGDPEIQAAVHNLFTPFGLLLTLSFAMVFTVALSALGGALAALVLRHPPRG